MSSAQRIVALQDPLVVENAATYKQRFLEALSAGTALKVDFSALESVDLSGIQLLIALLKEGHRQRKEIQFSGLLQESLTTRLRSSGVEYGDEGDSSRLEQALRDLIWIPSGQRKDR